ncbi:MAG: hypothetical protein PUF50_06080 [Erysipelotrichaceae bacterium]|nr:hypothetical protein [Erysipelotrichaceae bacterium]
MKKKDTLLKGFAYASLFMMVWVWISAIYYFAEMIGISMEQTGLYMWGIGLVGSIILYWKLHNKWYEIWYILKPSLLRTIIFLWHLFVFFVTRNILFNFIVAIFFALYSLRRCEELHLKGLDIANETQKILKWNNNALYMSSIFFLWYQIKMTWIVEAIMQFTGLDYIWSMVVLICLFMIAIFGLVRFQYIIGLNVAHVKLNQSNGGKS